MIDNYSILNVGKCFGENTSQNYLEFQQFSRYFTSEKGKIGSLESKEMSEEIIHLHLQHAIVLI